MKRDIKSKKNVGYNLGIEKKLREYGFTAISVIPFDFMHPQIPEFLLDVAEQLTSVIEKVPILKEIAGSLIIQCRKK